jgi:molybdate transport system ATP-binding protein
MNTRSNARIDIRVVKSLSAGATPFTLNIAFCSADDRVIVVGPSGVGKSLLMQSIAGTVRPDAGHVRLAGRTLFDADAGIDIPAHKRRLGVVFQDYALFPHLDVRQNVGFGLTKGALTMARYRREPRVEDWLARMDLEHVAHHYPDQLSGGQRQRVAVARAAISEPAALLLDEPFAALDPSLRRLVRDQVDALQRRLDIPLLLITHDKEDAVALGGHVVTVGTEPHRREGTATSP